MSRMSWGHGLGAPGDAFFRGRAGVVIEMAPNQFCSYVMTGTFGEIEIQRDVETIHSWEILSPIYVPMPAEVHMVLTGTLSSMEEAAQRPAWARAEHELPWRREIER